MHNYTRSNVALGALVAAAVLAAAPAALAAEASERARELAQKYLLADTHIDVPYRLHNHWEDVTAATEQGEFDEPRARAGGLDLPFMSIYTPAKLEADGGAWELANQLIDAVEAMVARAPESFTIVATPDEAVAAKAAGKIGLALGMENGSPLEGKLENVGFFRDRGISYITLAHSLANHLSDSSYDKARPNDGLSDFGHQVVAEMNRLGVMVDVSHLSDKAFYDVLEASQVPVIASHSSARHFTPGFERNMDDDMIRALASNGGLVMINFGSSFLTADARGWYDDFNAARDAWTEAASEPPSQEDTRAFFNDYRERKPFPFANVEQTVAHFVHVIDLVGVDYVGIGSDYDGVGDSLPEGLKDVSTYPVLVDALLEKGYSEEDIAKVLGGNLIRVWGEIVDAASA
ncbi:membrane dipeptidase [Marinihelvus fidelis]|uniref:Membrane dipeptidase n=1 Tax=Marinihelvus fidelis TaxID=2613842 RepID=A0A5N0T8A3_9GAMM|nr:dipeptidase [Marinihelvus fidelis]KAA9130981.1 membrane dipeptidase [Marinihelvus fidelis]